MDAIANGALGPNDWPAHGAVVRADHERQAASRNGLSGLPGHHTVGREVFGATSRSSGGTRVDYRRLPLQKRRIDFEELARPGAAAIRCVLYGHTTSRQHPRTGILRIGEPTCYKNR